MKEKEVTRLGTYGGIPALIIITNNIHVTTQCPIPNASINPSFIFGNTKLTSTTNQ